MNATQLKLDSFEASQERDKGIAQAAASADAANSDWNIKAYEMLVEWLKGWASGYCFMMEDFRKIAQIRGLPDPPSARSFGGIALKAKFAGLIKSNGRKATTAVSAHRCFATEWTKI